LFASTAPAANQIPLPAHCRPSCLTCTKRSEKATSRTGGSGKGALLLPRRPRRRVDEEGTRPAVGKHTRVLGDLALHRAPRDDLHMHAPARARARTRRHTAAPRKLDNSGKHTRADPCWRHQNMCDMTPCSFFAVSTHPPPPRCLSSSSHSPRPSAERARTLGTGRRPAPHLRPDD